jgi:hypothetical protein
MFTWSFWKDALERTIRTFAQTLAAVILVGQTSLVDMDWSADLGIAGAAALASLLSALAFPAKSTAPVFATVPVASLATMGAGGFTPAQGLPLASGGIVEDPGQLLMAGEPNTTHEG